MGKSLYRVMQDYSKFLERNYAHYLRTQTPQLPAYPIVPGTYVGTVLTLMQGYIHDHPDLTNLRDDRFIVKMFSSMNGKKNNVSMSICLSPSHPLSIAIGQSTLEVYSATIGDLKRKKTAGVSAPSSPMIFEHIAFNKAVVNQDEFPFNLTNETLASAIKEEFIKKYGDFFEHLCVLDELQADFTPSENNAFNQALRKACYSVTYPIIGHTEDMLDANKRYAIITAWKNFLNESSESDE